jgi:hypothetical protein
MDTAIQTAASDKLSTSIRALTCGLESAGWKIRCFEMNMATERAKIELARADGRIVTFLARNGSAVIERFAESREMVSVGRKGDRFITDRLRVDFLGRQSFTCARPGLRALCSYIADNSMRALAAGEVRALLAPLMQ